MIATLAETGNPMGIRWRPGSASAAKGATERLPLLVARLRDAGVNQIAVRLDKGFFSRAMVERFDGLGVLDLLKVPDHHWVCDALGDMRCSAKSRETTKDPAVAIWSASGTLYDARLLSLDWRRTEDTDDELFERTRITQRSHVITNLPSLHARTAWRAYNDGAVVEQRIEELAQLGAGRTVVDDLDRNALLWQMAGLAYQILHLIRSTALQGSWRTAQPNRLRNWVFRMPGKLTHHAREYYVQLPCTEPLGLLWLRALRTVGELRGPPQFLPSA